MLRALAFRTFAILGLTVFALLPARAQDLRGVAVVLIHGKAGGQGPLQGIAAALRKEGAAVVMPRMSWASAYRPYDATVQEVAAAVAAARRTGARKVFLAGHSMGANIALGYSASGGAVDGIVAMAPGHRPDFIATLTGDSLPAARAMVAAGRGREKARFQDFNQGRVYPISTTAEAYLSFFEPDGPAGRAARAGGVRAPVLWVIGTADRPAMRDNAPHSTGQRIVIEANHQNTPARGTDQIIAWLKQR